eukprot:Mycagemm_TRINITY_DN10221_c0_g4::TRINITY_DN10221_c0_g4_i1::g.3836::m.3836 type:complete len:145 gc:universal TRINITY_DN10221_c0_g4_i1:643-209(-)
MYCRSTVSDQALYWNVFRNVPNPSGIPLPIMVLSLSLIAPSLLRSLYLTSPGSMLYFFACSASPVDHIPSCTRPKKNPTGSPTLITVAPEKMSLPPDNASTLFLFTEILKVVLHEKSPALMFIEFTANSTPLFSILPTLVKILA